MDMKIYLDRAPLKYIYEIELKTMSTNPPVGEIKKLVSLVDRSDFDEFVFPQDSTKTAFRAAPKPYQVLTQETAVWTFAGSPNWGQRMTFSVPWPWQSDFLTWIALRLKPSSWLPSEVLSRMSPNGITYVPTNPEDLFVWAKSLGTIAIERAELEVDGVILETFSGDWINVWNKLYHDVSNGAAYDDGVYNSNTTVTPNNICASEDGYIYCYLPFMFSKHVNTAFPILSSQGPDTIRFHITLRPFSQVIRKIQTPLSCNQTPCGTTFTVRDYSYPYRQLTDITIPLRVPSFETADIVCGISNVNDAMRRTYIEKPHEILFSPVVETTFAEPLKYVTNRSAGSSIHISLPLTDANGPIRQILFFLRRNASVALFNDWNNYSAVLENEVDSTWNPLRPLLQHAQLQVGTAVWADQEERWWRAVNSVVMPGGVRGYGNYIYGYNFADQPAEFSPSGSVNASRVDMKLNLTVAAPGGAADGEWSVTVFYISHNWLRFQNGLANMVFMD